MSEVPAPPVGPPPSRRDPDAPRALAPPFVAVVAYTLRACLPAKRWFGVLLPCAGALLFGWLTHVNTDSAEQAFSDVAEAGLFRLILPLTCLIIGDAVLGADVRSGTFPLTWLSPVPFRVIVAGRWLGGWLVALVTLVPAMALAPLIAGVPEAVGPMAIAAAAGAAAYIALFLLIGVLVRRSALWSLAIVLLGEWLLGTTLTGIAQVSPLWEAQQVFAGLWDDGDLLLRSGIASGNGAIVRLLIITLVGLALATWRLGRMRPIGGDD
jgi:ABC-2 type transport system permease protein